MPITRTSYVLPPDFAAARSTDAQRTKTTAMAEERNSERSRRYEPASGVRTESGQKTTHPDGRPKDRLELSREAQEIRELQARDQEVRTHEAAHAAAGGAYAGAPSYTYERGPDGRSYATGGEVSIDISPIPGDPQATLQKAQQVRSAALAPAQPSAQDMRVAQKATVLAAKARQDLRSEAIDQPERAQSAAGSPTNDAPSTPGNSAAPSHSGTARLTESA